MKEIPPNELKKMVLDDQLDILEAINFEFNLDLPFIYFYKVANEFKDKPAEVKRSGVKFITRSYCFSLCLQFKPWKIAGAAFYLSKKKLEIS